MTGRAVYPEKFIAEFCARRQLGEPNDRLCAEMKINRKTGQAWWYRHKRSNARRGTDGAPEPKTKGQVRQNAASRRAYDDFAYFRLVCFGYKTPPAHLRVIEQLREAVESGKRDYVLWNQFPGAGKTSLMQHFVCWLIARDRTIRIMWGSASDNLATVRVREIRQELARTIPWDGRPEDITTGRAVRPRYCMTQLFGRFRPSAHHGTTWTDSEFTVCTVGTLHDPEGPPPSGLTLVALGRRTAQPGMRANFIVWDDIWTEKEEANPEVGAEVKRYFDRTIDSRLQPNGVLCLVMQRMGANDLSRHVLDKRTPTRDPETGEETGWAPVYRHVVFPAHHDLLCTGTHPDGMVAWDPANPVMGSCLTDPLAFGPDDYLRMRGNTAVFKVWYQQEDADPKTAVIREVWITGGADEDGDYRGCLDYDRGLWQPPDGIAAKDLLSACAVDVGQKNYWGLFASVWPTDTDSENEWCLAADHRRMPAGTEYGLLDWDFDRKVFVGVLEDWYQRSKDAGVPFTHVVAEANAAQRHLFRDNNNVDRWQLSRNCRIIAHTTTNRNKNDAKLGIEAVLPIRFQLGAVRLPWRPGEAQNMMRALVNEAKGYQQGWPTDDILMSMWFLRLNRRRIARPLHAVTPNREGDVPHWVREMA